LRVDKGFVQVSSSFSLINAVTAGDESAVSAMLANGADVNETTNGGQTALIHAVIFGHTNLVRMLMNAGADPQLRDNLGLNAIDWAQRRGLTEAHGILTRRPESTTSRIVIPLEEPQKSAPDPTPDSRVNETKASADNGEKSRRWLAGLKQRFDEQEMRRLNRNEPPVERRIVREEPLPPPPPPVETKAPEPEPPKEIRFTGAPRILTPPPVEPPKTGKRKPLVDADEPIVPVEKPRSNAPLFWILLIITLTGSVVAGSLITTYFYKSNQAATRSAAEQQKKVQKGAPEVGTELAGQAVSLPEAECPIRGSEPVAGTVTVRIMIDKNGQVYWARGSGGDWLMRGCATEAAMKSTFDRTKLRDREVEGTITYTFKP
jgi:Ankyrin repeats (many copies)